MTYAFLACLLAVGAAGCGSSGKHAQAPSASQSALTSLRLCLRHHGYAVTPESAAVRRTAPGRFEFLHVWNLLNPNRVTLTLTISKSATGAARAVVWTRQENAKIGKGVVHAPAVRLGRIDALWTAVPGRASKKDIYGCVRSSS